MPGIARRLLTHRPRHLLGSDGDAVGAADFRQQQAEAHPAVGDGAVLGAQRVVVLAGVVGVQRARLALLFQPFPDLVELGLRHALGDGEIDLSSASASSSSRFSRRRGIWSYSRCICSRDRLTQRIQVGEAQFLGQRIVRRRHAATLQRLGDDLELRRLAGQGGGAVVLRESDVDGAGLAGLHAFELFREARDEAAAGDLQIARRSPCRLGTPRRRPCRCSRPSARRPFRRRAPR